MRRAVLDGDALVWLACVDDVLGLPSRLDGVAVPIWRWAQVALSRVVFALTRGAVPAVLDGVAAAVCASGGREFEPQRTQRTHRVAGVDAGVSAVALPDLGHPLGSPVSREKTPPVRSRARFFRPAVLRVAE